MRIYKHEKGWYVCNGKIGGRFLFGAGRTHREAMVNAFLS